LDKVGNYTYNPYHICECYKGHTGYACEACANDFFGGGCVRCPVGKNGAVCSGHGVCDDGLAGKGTCLCFEDYSIDSDCYEEATFDEKESIVTMRMLYALGAGIVCILLIYAFIRLPGLHFLPDCVASIVIGIGIGLILTENDYALADSIRLDPQTFFLFMLPPILYDAGYYAEKTRFFKNMPTIIVFAVFGTFVSAFVFAGLLYLCCNLFELYDLSVLDALIFGSLISAVDPVATIGIFNAL
jgi:hypothetical protein